MPEIHLIGIAGLKVAAAPDKIRTVLGSCVGIAIFDRNKNLGGLAHVILPSSSNGSGDKGKFADTAVDWLVDELVNAGALRQRLVAKIAGGATMFGTASNTGIGERNIEAVRTRLQEHQISLAAEHIGGTKGRRMLIDPASGEVEVQVLGAETKKL